MAPTRPTQHRAAEPPPKPYESKSQQRKSRKRNQTGNIDGARVIGEIALTARTFGVSAETVFLSQLQKDTPYVDKAAQIQSRNKDHLFGSGFHVGVYTTKSMVHICFRANVSPTGVWSTFDKTGGLVDGPELVHLPPEEIEASISRRIWSVTYANQISPHAKKLNKYKPFTKTVYGELLPPLVSRIIHHTNLTSNQVFLDAGCGVGNIVAQAALETQCKAVGIELCETPAELAVQTLRNLKLRCLVAKIPCGEMKVEQGDMLTSQTVLKLIPEVNVLMLNNKAFPSELNDQVLHQLIVALPDGAYVVTLSPLSSEETTRRRTNARNVNSVERILRVHCLLKLGSGDTSWVDKSSDICYIYRVDREGHQAEVEEFRNREEQASARRTRRAVREK